MVKKLVQVKQPMINKQQDQNSNPGLRPKSTLLSRRNTTLSKVSTFFYDCAASLPKIFVPEKPLLGTVDLTIMEQIQIRCAALKAPSVR